MNLRCHQDNVLIILDPLPTETASGIAIVRQGGPKAREHRTARVVASGPGYYTKLGALVPNTVKPGDRVVVDAQAGDRMKWNWDLSAPRQNDIPGFDSLLGERCEARVVREQEILGIVEEDQAAE